MHGINEFAAVGIFEVKGIGGRAKVNQGVCVDDSPLACSDGFFLRQQGTGVK